MTADTGGKDIARLHARSVELFLDRVRAVPDDAWDRPTPCSDWDVRALVNHVVGEDRWTPPLIAGQTISDVGDRFDGDLLGDAPVAAAEAAGKDAVDALSAPGVLDRIVHLSFGDTPAAEYAWQLFADHVVHAWDLAAGAGGDRSLDPELVDACAGWWAAWEQTYRGAGAVAERVDLGSDASRQDILLSSFGREPDWRPPR